MRRTKLLLATATTLIISCASLGDRGITKTSDVKYEVTVSSTIKVYSSTQPEKAFVEIETVSVLRVKSLVMPLPRNSEKIKAEMQEKASSIGGHAFIDYIESGEANMTGTVIRFK